MRVLRRAADEARVIPMADILVCLAHGMPRDAHGDCAVCRVGRTPVTTTSETTSDNRERLLYDVMDAVGIIGQRLCSDPYAKQQGALLIELWRRGENLGVLKGERP